MAMVQKKQLAIVEAPPPLRVIETKTPDIIREMPKVHDGKRSNGRRAVSLFSRRGIGTKP